MSVRRLAKMQPASFAFSKATKAKCDWWIAKYPEGRKASAVIPILWLVQKQEGWCPEPALRAIADIGWAAMVGVGLLLVGGLVMIANLYDPRNARHPSGRMGRLRDELLVIGTLLPMLAMVVAGALAPGLRDADMWTPVFFAVAIAGLGASFLPAFTSARRRIAKLHSRPRQ